MGQGNAACGSLQLARDWPHQVALPSEPVVVHHPEIVAFCRVLSVAPRTHSVRHGDCDYTVFCFSDAADAARFRERWGGEPFELRDKGKGNEWFKWHKGPPTTRRNTT